MTKSSMMRVRTRIGTTDQLTCVKCVPALCFMSVDCTLATMGKFKNWLDNKYEGCLRIPNSKIKPDGRYFCIKLLDISNIGEGLGQLQYFGSHLPIIGKIIVFSQYSLMGLKSCLYIIHLAICT